MPRARFLKDVFTVREGMRLDPGEMIARLVEAGYERVDVTEARGQCALRGGILECTRRPAERAAPGVLRRRGGPPPGLRRDDPALHRPAQGGRDLPGGEILLNAAEAVAAAERLELALGAARGSAQPVDRQREIEKEFDLMPFEQFFECSGRGTRRRCPPCSI